jgi:hypothetical protein
MAVTQISKIQVRYGLQADLINLDTGEFGWAIDSQRLFIGSGSISEGAPYGGMTEIVTGAVDISKLLGNYIYKGLAGGYVVQTGKDFDSDIVRSWQDKVDDFVNSRDFGTAGTGNQDDTEALQRAIDQIYNKKWINVATKTRRVLRLNAGIYRLDGDIKIPPYASIVGEGKDSVILLLSGTSNKFKLATSTGADSDIENDSIEYPKGIQIKGVTFASSHNSNLFSIDGVTEISFNDVKFSGAVPTTVAPPIGTNVGVDISSTIKVAENIIFSNCTFENLTQAVSISSSTGSYDITFDKCKFNNLHTGISIINSGATAPHSVKISNSFFTNITKHAIFSDLEVSGVVSLGNTFNNVGSNFEGDAVAPLTSWWPIIVFQAHGNYSIADIFKRTISNSALYPRISSQGWSFVSLSMDDAFKLGNSHYTAGNLVEIPAMATGFAVLPNFKYGVINYTVTYNSDVRVGAIKVIGVLESDSTMIFDDDYIETNEISIAMGVAKVGNETRLQWTTSGSTASFKLVFDTKTLQ